MLKDVVDFCRGLITLGWGALRLVGVEALLLGELWCDAESTLETAIITLPRPANQAIYLAFPKPNAPRFLCSDYWVGHG